MNGECRHGIQKKICWHCSEKNNDVSKSSSNGGLAALRVDEEMLTRAMDKAVELGLIAEWADEETYLRNWAGMKEVLQAALGN